MSATVWAPGGLQVPVYPQLQALTGASFIGFTQKGVGAVSRTTEQELRDRISPTQFGAKFDGISDDQPGIQRAINYVQDFFNSGIVILPSGSKVKLGSGLAIDTNKCGIEWNGAIVDCSSFTAGMQVYTISQSASDVNRRPALNRSHPLRNATYIGPGKAVNCTISNIQDLAATQVIAGVTFEGGGAWGWKVGLTLGRGCFFTSITNFDFAAVVGTDMGTCISIPNAVNSGEKNELNNVRFGAADLYLSQANGNADTHFQRASFNYADRMMDITGGSVYVNGFHVEGNSDVDYWFKLSGSNSVLSFCHGPFVIAGAKTLKEVIYCDASVTHGAVFLDDFGINDNSQYTMALVGGSGRVQASHMTNYAAGDQPVISSSLNLLAYGDFENPNSINEWALAGTSLPSRSNLLSHSGAWSLQFQGVAGQNNRATRTNRCSPGQMAAVDMWAAMTGYVAGGNLYGQWMFLDSAGNILLTGASLNVTANQPFTKYNFGAIGPAPAGTVSFQVDISFFNVVTGTPLGYVDDVVINLIN